MWGGCDVCNIIGYRVVEGFTFFYIERVMINRGRFCGWYFSLFKGWI